MVDGVNSNNGNNILKLKGQNKSINLNQLEGLRKTRQNESVFKMADKNNDGVIDEQEAKDFSAKLQQLAGDKTLSQREMRKYNGAFQALSNLADQQAQLQQEGKYTEVNGPETTVIFAGKNGIKDSYGQTTAVSKKGTIIMTGTDGSKEIRWKDGRVQKQFKDHIENSYPDGTVQKQFKDRIENTFPDGSREIINKKDNSVKHFYSDGKHSVTVDKDGKTIGRSDFQDGKVVDTKYEYDGNKTIVRRNVNNKPSPIQVKDRDGNSNVESYYNNETELKQNKPYKTVKNPENETIKTETTYEYSEKGYVKAFTTNSAGETVSITFADSKGNTIPADDFYNDNPAPVSTEVEDAPVSTSKDVEEPEDSGDDDDEDKIEDKEEPEEVERPEYARVEAPSESVERTQKTSEKKTPEEIMKDLDQRMKKFETKHNIKTRGEVIVPSSAQDQKEYRQYLNDLMQYNKLARSK